MTTLRSEFPARATNAALAVLFGLVLICGRTPAKAAQPKSDNGLSGAEVIQPEELARALQSSQDKKPLILQVGFHVLYVQAHIPGSEYVGSANDQQGLAQLRDRARALPRGQAIVLYCGCCPWIRCPNMKPAYAALKEMGFTNIKVLYIEKNFGTDWVDKGFPTAKGA